MAGGAILDIRTARRLAYHESGYREGGATIPMSEVEVRYEILRLLRLHGEMGGEGLPTLKELAQATGHREREVRRVCAVMEALDYVRGHHTAGGDQNPAYEITVEGLVMLHKQEHVYGKSFFDEAMQAAPANPQPERRDIDLPADAGEASENSPGKARPKSS